MSIPVRQILIVCVVLQRNKRAHAPVNGGCIGTSTNIDADGMTVK
jgi:hypothetical protein